MKVGDTVQLRQSVQSRRKGKRQTAKVTQMRGDGGVRLDKRLCDFSWWHKDDLELAATSTSAKEKA